MNIKFNIFYKLGCLSMFMLVGLGAKYGHTGKLDQDSISLFNKAQFYQLMNNVGLLSVALICKSNRQTKIAGGLFLGGLFLFCFPLYVMAIHQRSQILSKTMPFGGMMMLGGWLAMIFI